MSKLALYARPLVAFDPYNKDHRRYFAEFLEYGGWGKCPVRFICPEENGMGDLPHMIKQQLVNFYVEREFGGSKFALQRSASLKERAKELTDKAAALQREAVALVAPRRMLESKHT